MNYRYCQARLKLPQGLNDFVSEANNALCMLLLILAIKIKWVYSTPTLNFNTFSVVIVVPTNNF